MWHVYILKCNDGTYYPGCTSDMTDILNRHNQGQIKYTSTRLPVNLVATINFNSKFIANDFENYLKSGPGRACMNQRFI